MAAGALGENVLNKCPLCGCEIENSKHLPTIRPDEDVGNVGPEERRVRPLHHDTQNNSSPYGALFDLMACATPKKRGAIHDAEAPPRPRLPSSPALSSSQRHAARKGGSSMIGRSPPPLGAQRPDRTPSFNVGPRRRGGMRDTGASVASASPPAIGGGASVRARSSTDNAE